MFKIDIIVEARMGSKRLPGKVLRLSNKKPMLYWMFKRLKLIKYVSNIIIATTKLNVDNEICDFANKNNIKYYRGSENNVLQRVINAANENSTDQIVEITGDDPLVDPFIVSEIIDSHIKNYSTNKISANDFYKQVPLGSNARIFSFSLLKKINQLTKNNFHRENVESYFYQNYKKFNFNHTHLNKNFKRNDIRLTMDTIEDFKVIDSILSYFLPKIDFTLKEIIQFLDLNPKIKNINSKIVQNEIR